jgi:hypothetical protein
VTKIKARRWMRYFPSRKDPSPSARFLVEGGGFLSAGKTLVLAHLENAEFRIADARRGVRARSEHTPRFRRAFTALSLLCAQDTWKERAASPRMGSEEGRPRGRSSDRRRGAIDASFTAVALAASMRPVGAAFEVACF